MFNYNITMIKLNQIPNILTISRIIAIPIWLISFYYNFYSLCVFLIVYSATSDFLDGWSARKLKTSSIFGESLDPIADKIFLTVVLISYVSDARANFILVSLIIIREIIVSSLREILSKYNKSKVLKVSFLAKIKTSLQFATILVLACVPININISEKIQFYGTILLYITAIITIITGYKYVTISIKELRKIIKSK